MSAEELSGALATSAGPTRQPVAAGFYLRPQAPLPHANATQLRKTPRSHRPLCEAPAERNVCTTDFRDNDESVVFTHEASLHQALIDVLDQRLLRVVGAALDEGDFQHQEVFRVLEVQVALGVNEVTLVVLHNDRE